MSRAALFVIFGLIPTCASAGTDVYRCTDGHVPSFQAIECGRSGGKMPLAVPQPDASDRKLAESTARRERDFVRRTEDEREKQVRAADAERAEQLVAERRHSERCARYVREAGKLEDDNRSLRRASHRKHVKEVRARELRDRYFTECLGPR